MSKAEKMRGRLASIQKDREEFEKQRKELEADMNVGRNNMSKIKKGLKNNAILEEPIEIDASLIGHSHGKSSGNSVRQGAGASKDNNNNDHSNSNGAAGNGNLKVGGIPENGTTNGGGGGSGAHATTNGGGTSSNGATPMNAPASTPSSTHNSSHFFTPVGATGNGNGNGNGGSYNSAATSNLVHISSSAGGGGGGGGGGGNAANSVSQIGIMPSGPRISDWCYTAPLDSMNPPVVKSRELYENVRPLGRGSFGEVHLVKNTEDNKL